MAIFRSSPGGKSLTLKLFRVVPHGTLDVVASGAIDGTGDVTFAVSSLDATGLETFTGTAGSETFAGPALASTGLETFTGTAAVAFGGPAFAATGAETFTGTGTETFAGPSLAASGSEAFTGTGAEAFGVPALSGAALETFTGTGAVTFAGPALDGGVPQAVTGAGAVAFAGPGLDGLGTGGTVEAPVVGGGRRYIYPPYRAAAPQAIEGIGEIRFKAPRLSGVGVLGFTGTGATAIAPAALAGDGGTTIDGAGTLAASVALDGSGVVLNRRLVSVKAQSPARSIHGVGNLTAKAAIPVAVGAVRHPAPDPIDRAWADLQTDEDALLLGVL